MSLERGDGKYVYPGTELATFAPARRWRSYWQSRVAELLRCDVLEVGAGIGTITQNLAPFSNRWLALEPDGHLASQLQTATTAIPNVEVRLGHIGALSADERFDAIIYIDVIEHIEDDAEQLRTAVHHLKPDGHLVVLAPAFPSLYSRFDAAVGHYRRYTRASLVALTPPGLIVRRIEHLDSMGAVVSFLNRFGRNQEQPDRWQIMLWDRFLIPLSRILDPLTGRRMGKSLLIIWQAP